MHFASCKPSKVKRIDCDDSPDTVIIIIGLHIEMSAVFYKNCILILLLLLLYFYHYWDQPVFLFLFLFLFFWQILLNKEINKLWCNQAKWVWSRKIWFSFCFVLFFWQFLLVHWLGFNLVKTPLRLDNNWFQRYKQSKDWTNNKKLKLKEAIRFVCCILKTVFASSHSFCVITSQLMIFCSRNCCQLYKQFVLDGHKCFCVKI